MVFSSVPLYLDPPNWQQHHHQVINNGASEINEQILSQHQHQQHQLQLQPPPSPIPIPVPQLQQQQPPPPPPPISSTASARGGTTVGSTTSRASSSSSSSISMSERARLAKMVPQQGPDGGPLKCPRCESTNTKFCYFNNYSLTQPRHFCKTCRRYWTLGGALRNVPVGGGCRRNKRSSSSSSKNAANRSNNKSSPLGGAAAGVSGSEQPPQLGAGRGSGSISSSALLAQLTGLNNNINMAPPPPSQLSFMGSLQLQNLTAQLGIGSTDNNLGLGARFSNIDQMSQQHEADFGGIQQQQHLPHILAGFGVYPFQSDAAATPSFYVNNGQQYQLGGDNQILMMRPPTKTTTIPVKSEDVSVVSGIQLGQTEPGAEAATDHHRQEDNHRQIMTSSSSSNMLLPSFWGRNTSNNGSSNNNNNDNNNNGLVAATTTLSNGLWTDLSGL